MILARMAQNPKGMVLVVASLVAIMMVVMVVMRMGHILVHLRLIMAMVPIHPLIIPLIIMGVQKGWLSRDLTLFVVCLVRKWVNGDKCCHSLAVSWMRVARLLGC
ncbi:MAG: hypothetical protein EBQ89_07330 [Alphaproteobacteria bacterium]|nr:hypothetical protein [Alphaproteobacteria bacterium]